MNRDSSPKDRFDTFLSYKRTDIKLAKELLSLLRHYNLTVWFDEDELRPGVSWQYLMQRGIENSQSGVVVFGNDGIGPWQNEEMQALLDLAVYYSGSLPSDVHCSLSKPR
jgi:TIR domain